MWICRYCAAHVNDGVLKCPCCETATPARLPHGLADQISDEVKEAPQRMQINWLTLKALPNLRKRAQSPWSWAMFGFVFGLGCGVVSFRRTLRSTAKAENVLLQAILCGMALSLVFGLLGAVLRSRRERWNRDTHLVEIGGILGFFLVLIPSVIDAFINHCGWESLEYLLSNSIPIIGLGIFTSIIGFFSGGFVVPLLKLLVGPLLRRFRSKEPGQGALASSQSPSGENED